MKSNIVTKTNIPSSIGKAQSEFFSDEFDFLVHSKGYEVVHENSIPCPCRSKDNGNPLSSCQNCAGSGWNIINPNKTKMVLQSLNARTKYSDWSKENIGTVSITSRSVDKLAYMDRITVLDSDVIFSQILYPYTYNNTLFSFTIYDILSIEEIFVFVEPNLPLLKLEEGQYSFTKNKLILSDEFLDIENLTISCRYHHKLQYHIIDLNHQVRNSYVFDSTKLDKVKSEIFPFGAIGRLSHYVLDALNYEGNNIIDNSYIKH